MPLSNFDNVEISCAAHFSSVNAFLRRGLFRVSGDLPLFAEEHHLQQCHRDHEDQDSQQTVSTDKEKHVHLTLYISYIGFNKVLYSVITRTA